MAALEKAQQGLLLLKEAVLEEVANSDSALPHAAIVKRLRLESDFEGVGRNYISWSVLGLLVNEGRVMYRGSRTERVYYVKESQLQSYDCANPR